MGCCSWVLILCPVFFRGTSENWTVHCCIWHGLPFFSAAGLSSSNSRHTAPAINVFAICTPKPEKRENVFQKTGFFPALSPWMMMMTTNDDNDDILCNCFTCGCCCCRPQRDQRHLVLDCVPEERQQILLSYIDDLERKGLPPPPTACEPSRRSAKWPDSQP